VFAFVPWHLTRMGREQTITYAADGVTDVRELQHQMHLIRCVSIRNLFQMKSMKLKWNMRNTAKKEFTHEEEL
jgi:hypothetical protein